MSQSRESTSLKGPPDDPARLGDFPRQILAPDQTLLRVVRKGYGPWWFGSSMTGRFDLPEPEGTCYLAADELAALLEVLGPDLEGGAVSRDFIEVRRIRKLNLPREMTLADLISRRVAGFGITAEIGSIVPYELPQAWAARLRAAGIEGAVYWLRHDPSRALGYAIFGPHGDREDWSPGEEQPIDDDLLRRLQEECGVVVLPIPEVSELTLLED